MSSKSAQQFDQLLRILNRLPYFFWNLLVSIFEWLAPPSWYAKDVSNEIVLITGAGSGLGRAIALEFAQLGSSLILWDINQVGLDETKKLIDQAHMDWIGNQRAVTLKRYCLTYVVDVSDREVVQQAANKVMLDINKIDNDGETERFVSVLVNNAGIYHGLLLDDLTDQQIERVFKINILSHFWTVRAFLPHMKRHERGHIVEIASMGGISGLFKQVDYCATKFATVGFEESLSIELDYQGYADKIRTTVVCPFFFNSNLFSGFDSKISDLMTSDFVAKETVIAMRCNHSRVLLPKFTAYSLQLFKSWVPRQAMIDLNKVFRFDESIKTIKGHAASLNKAA